MYEDESLDTYVFERQLLVGHYDLALYYVLSSRPSTHNVLGLTEAFTIHHSVLRHPGARRLLDAVLGLLLDRYPSLYTINTIFFLRALYPVSLDLKTLYVSRAQDLCALSRKYDDVPWLYLVLEMIAGRSRCRYVINGPGTWSAELRLTRERAQHLVWCVEAGLTTSDPTRKQAALPLPPHSRYPFSLCVEHGMFHEARLMYETGAVSLPELHYHERGLSDRARPLTPMDDFLLHVCTQPPTLQTMCATLVSRRIGCGAGRQRRARIPGVPEPAVRMVLFTHPVLRYQAAVDDMLQSAHRDSKVGLDIDKV